MRLPCHLNTLLLPQLLLLANCFFFPRNSAKHLAFLHWREGWFLFFFPDLLYTDFQHFVHTENKDISCLERIHRRSTKYILNDYSTDYKSRLQTLHLLPIALWLDLHDLLFLVKCLQDQENNLEIYRYITCRSTCTRTGSTGHMLNINYTRTSAARHFYFNRIVFGTQFNQQ